MGEAYVVVGTIACFMYFRKELANLDKFREQQKMIEELNTRKKRMLSEAIKQR